MEGAVIFVMFWGDLLNIYAFHVFYFTCNINRLDKVTSSTNKHVIVADSILSWVNISIRLTAS